MGLRLITLPEKNKKKKTVLLSTDFKYEQDLMQNMQTNRNIQNTDKQTNELPLPQSRKSQC